MEFIFITKDPLQAKELVLEGVDHIMVDLESIGKVNRQGHLDTVISDHKVSDVTSVRKALDQCAAGSLMVRINPIGLHTKTELDEVLSRGADRIMLPMFRHPDEVCHCLELIDERAPLTLLLETAAAFSRLPYILDMNGMVDFHIGLNDLHLDMGLDFMFELFGSGLIDHAADLITAAGRIFGIGGVSCIGSGELPAELILAAHKQLGSQRVILSRSFHRMLQNGCDIGQEINNIRAYLAREDLNLPQLREELHVRSKYIADQIRYRSSSWCRM